MSTWIIIELNCVREVRGELTCRYKPCLIRDDVVEYWTGYWSRYWDGLPISGQWDSFILAEKECDRLDLISQVTES